MVALVRLALTRGLVGLLPVLAASPLQADVFCVGDVDALNARLTEAQSNGVADEIRVQSGTYAGGFLYVSGEGQDLAISGGWDPTCTSQTRDPRLTVLDGTNTQRPLQINHITSAGSTHLEYLSFMNGFASGMGAGNNRGGGVWLPGAVGATGDATVRYCILGNNVSDEFGGGLSIASGGTIRLENNLLYENTAFNNGAVSLTANDGTVYITNNTMADNHATSTSQPVGGLRLGGNAMHFVDNNILWGNDMADLNIQGNVVLNNNNVGVTLGTPAAGSMNNISADPMMSAEDDYALFINSPSINAGRNDPAGGLPAFDLFGLNRIFGVIVDQGATEVIDILFADGFES